MNKLWNTPLSPPIYWLKGEGGESKAYRAATAMYGHFLNLFKSEQYSSQLTFMTLAQPHTRTQPPISQHASNF